MPEFFGKKKIFVVSDAHFDRIPVNHKLNSFLSFLNYVKKNGDVLFLVGDIFDFYFEYPSFIPKHFFEVFHGLKFLAEQGIEIHYWAGNHDFYLGDFFETIGIKKHFAPELIFSGGKRFLVLHGDELENGISLKKIMSGKIPRFLFSLLHPEVGFIMARILSNLSRKLSSSKSIERNYIGKLVEKKIENNYDVVIFGHFHVSFCTKKEGIYTVSIGDWKNLESYALISNGDIFLRRFNQSPR